MPDAHGCMHGRPLARSNSPHGRNAVQETVIGNVIGRGLCEVEQAYGRAMHKMDELAKREMEVE